MKIALLLLMLMGSYSHEGINSGDINVLQTHPTDKELRLYMDENKIKPLDIHVQPKETLILTENELIRVEKDPIEGELLSMGVGWEPASSEVKAYARINDGLLYFVVYDDELMKKTHTLDIGNSKQSRIIEYHGQKGMFVDLGDEFDAGGSINFLDKEGDIIHQEAFW
ncbi:hypothetical protein [Paenibacillus terrigena]|uniref:hypothetical protein n=1 Tax=Paenibacillus terrigena TaxID=369333 RepID=UPI00036C0901|nr:hypothetical protein [Paenibacillus terrigena]